MPLRFFPLLGAGVLLGLGSCAPKAVVTAEPAPQPVVKKKIEEKPGVPEPDAPVFSNNQPDDGVRLPNMLGLPADKELKATNPSVPKSGQDGGAVISRPPTEKKN